jgi:hypothetical protein
MAVKRYWYLYETQKYYSLFCVANKVQFRRCLTDICAALKGLIKNAGCYFFAHSEREGR